MKYDYDVIIVGAGPSGSTISRVLAQEGLEVMVFDKRKELGEPIRCGEGLGAREVIAQGIDLPKECISTDIKGAKVISPDGSSIVWKDKETTGWVLERKIFDKWLMEQAVHKGAKVQSYTRAIDVVKKDGKIQGVKVSHGDHEPYDVSAPLIVSAEGMEASLARKAGFRAVSTLYDVDTCYQYEMQEYDHENLIELYFGTKSSPRGYVWIFPKKDKKANVGIGIGAHLETGMKEGGIKGATPKDYLDRFIANHPQLKNSSKLQDSGGIISVSAAIDSFAKDNFMVTGTAARQVDPIHGGGIAMAMEGGLLAASTIMKAHKANDYSEKMLKEYETKWRSTLGKKVAKRLLLRKVMEAASDDDFNHIFKTINQHDLDEVMKGNFAGPVAKVVAGRPQLIGILKGLVSSRESS
jgi:digeranylgeranylglycerophospholipid reductase